MRKVRITKVPSMAYGGRIFNQVAPNALPYQTDEEMMHYKDTLQPVDREDANLEAEAGEEVLIPNLTGASAKFGVGGKRHFEGGTPLNLPDDSFVYSDTKAMKIKDPKILEVFGKAPKKGGYTPAQLAKPYDINKYRKVLDDPMSDGIQIKTAEEMIANYNVLLGKLALAQESKKGFPQGVPFVSEPYMMVNNLKGEDVLPMPEQQQGMGQPEQMPMAKYGGSRMVKIKQLPKAQIGFQSPVQRTMDLINPRSYPINPVTQKAEFKPQAQSADVNSGQIVPAGSHFTERDTNKFVDSIMPKTELEAYAKRQIVKPIIGAVATGLLNTGSETDDMLAYRTMEDTFTGTPTNKGTFDPLNKNNLPYKNDIAVYDNFTYSAKYGGNLPKAQDGLGVLRPEYLPSQDQAIADAMLSYLPGTQDAAANATAAAAQQAAVVQQNTGVPAVAPVAAPVAAANPKAVTRKLSSAKSKPSSKSSTDDLMSFNQDFWNEYAKINKEGKIKSDLPALNFTETERQRRAIQSSRGENIYGDLNWSDKDLLADFNRRQAWYLKENPDFDPHNKADVKDFQTKYCERASKFGVNTCYFNEAGKSGTGFDGKFGEHTWSAPGFNEGEAPAPATETEKGQDPIVPVDVKQPPYYNPFEYYPQDVLNLMTAMGTKIPDPKTYFSPLPYQGYSPAYIKEDYSPVMEAANIATQGIGAYGSRQRADASYSGIQGKAARQAADHNLQVANLNVGIYNDAEKFNSQTREKNMAYNIAQKQQNFDTREAYAADRIKAQNAKRANVTGLYNQMLTNAVDTYNLNSMNPNFKILPGTGGINAFINPDMLKPNKNALTNPRVREYESLRESGYTHDQAIDIIGRQTGKASYPQQQQYPYGNQYDYTTGLNYYES